VIARSFTCVDDEMRATLNHMYNVAKFFVISGQVRNYKNCCIFDTNLGQQCEVQTNLVEVFRFYLCIIMDRGTCTGIKYLERLVSYHSIPILVPLNVKTHIIARIYGVTTISLNISRI
jgi:hypothetical protein